MALTLTTPISVCADSTVITLQDILVPPHTALIVDSTSGLDVITSLKWLLTIEDIILDVSLSQEILVSVKNTTIKHSRYGIVGTIIPHLLVVDLDNTNTVVQLKINNTSNHTYSIKLTRMTL